MRSAEVIWDWIRSQEDGWGHRRSAEVSWVWVRSQKVPVWWGHKRSYEFNWGRMWSAKITRGQPRPQKGCWGPVRMAKVTWVWLRSHEITWGCILSHYVAWGHMGSNEISLRRVSICRSRSRRQSPRAEPDKKNGSGFTQKLLLQPSAKSGIWPDTGNKKISDYPPRYPASRISGASLIKVGPTKITSP